MAFWVVWDTDQQDGDGEGDAQHHLQIVLHPFHALIVAVLWDTRGRYTSHLSENQTAFRWRERSHRGINLGAGAVRLRGVAAAGVGDFGPVGWTLEETAALELEGRTLTIRSTEASGLIIAQ